MQEILDHGLRGEDRRTLRRLASGSSEEAEEEAARQVAAAIGTEMQALQETLVRNRRELLELSATTLPDRKRDLVVGLDAVRGELHGALDATRSELLAAKERGDLTVLRSMGRSFNDLKVLLQRLEGDRRKLTKNSALAALLVTVCRRVLPVRQINPADLRDIPPSHEGFLRIADFHLFSDAGLYDFGEHTAGPNLFTRLKRNVAILLVRDSQGQVIYNAFAVSGEFNTPGAPPVSASGPLHSIEAEDEHGRLFDRRYDAEFKLLSGFCTTLEGREQHESREEKDGEVESERQRPKRLKRGSAHADGEASAAPVSLPLGETSAPAPSVGSEASATSPESLAEASASAPVPIPEACVPIPCHVAWEGSARLWSRKPLCRSCAGAVQQLRSRYPRLSLDVVIGEADEAATLPPPSP